ncbi:hypothetical protein ACFYT4_06175 [Streptomyces sp. NPDC004609]|uniref:hypothetical protein n=1 Tax=Streptomyces sp. NPDC004609 TaxID=3364704 RepID=UPI00368E9B36
MAHLTFEDVLHVRLGRLDQAVTDWTAMIAKLERLADEARDNMKAKSDTARWQGENAGVTRPFVDKTTKEFRDAVTEATSVRNILRDGHTALKSARDELRRIVDSPPAGVTIWPDGVVARSVHPDRRAAGSTDPGPSAQTLDAVRDRITRALDTASDADDTVARALRDITEGHPYDFGDDRYAGLDDYRGQDRAESLRDADTAVGLASRGTRMSDAELARLNDLLAGNRDNPVFAERFAASLGAERTLGFYAGLTDPRQVPAISDARIRELGETQRNLGLVLAQATHSDTPAMRQWKQDVIELGPKPLEPGGASRPFGFQVMSNLMRDGVYDKKFLNDYGTALVATEKKMRLPEKYWHGPLNADTHLNFQDSDDDFGRDPMTGFMKALAHNPEASTQFFNTTEPQDNTAWVLGERDWFADGMKQDGPHANRDALGSALVAAATGMNPDDKNAVFTEHTVEHRQVLDRSLAQLSGAGDDFPPELRDDMAKILGNHGDVVHRAASSLDATTSPLDRDQLLEVAKQVSRDQNAYGMLNEALNRELVHDIHQDRGGNEPLLRAGQTVGFLEEARYQALATDKDDPSWNAKWAYHIGGGIVNFLPVVGDAAQRSVDVITYAWQLEEQGRINDRAGEDNAKVFKVREEQLGALAREWHAINPGLAESAYTAHDRINGAANDGNARAKGLAGDQ